MNFLLDTNVISEPMKVRPNAGVLDWLAQVDEDSTFLNVVTITELRYGVERLATCKRRDQLDKWLRKDLNSRFQERIMGRPIEPRDAFIAATAEVHGMTLVAQNESDFETTVKIDCDAVDLVAV